MKKLLIAGAGIRGREAYQWALDIQKAGQRWESIGFLDDNPHALDKYTMSDKIVGTIKDYVPKPDEEVVCALGEVESRAELRQLLVDKGVVFTNLIHPTAILSDRYVMGSDVMIGPGSVVSVDVIIGDSVFIDTYAIIGHDVTVEDGCIIRDHCDVMGFAYLEERAHLGGGSRILQHVRIGKNAKVGPSSVVIKSVKPNTSVFGNPAKEIYSPHTHPKTV